MSDKENMGMEPSVYKAWLVENADKKGTDTYKEVEAAWRSSGGKVAELSDEWEGATSPMDRLAVMAKYPFVKGAEMIKSATIKTAPVIAGEMIGGRYGGKAGKKVGAGAGALVGSVADQLRRGEGVKGGETMADIVTAVVNPRKAAAAGGTAAAASVLQQAIDKGEVDLNAVAAGAGMAGIGQASLNKIAPAPTRMSRADADNLLRYRAWNDVKDYGVVVNPSEISRGSPLLTAFGGGQAISVEAAQRNQNAWQRMAREQVDMPAKGDSLAIIPSTRRHGIKLEDGEIALKMKEVSAPYREIREISKQAQEEARLMAEQKLKNGKYVTAFTTKEGVDHMLSAADNLEKLRKLRYDIKREASSPDPSARDRLMAMRELEKELERSIEAAAVASGKEGLLERMKEARQKLAVLNVLDMATETYGQVNPEKLFKLREAGFPLSGNLEKMALFYDAFKPSASVTQQTHVQFGASPGWMARQAALGRPEGLLAGGFPFMGGAIKESLLSPKNQSKFMAPRLETMPRGAVSEAAQRVINQGAVEAARRMGL